MSYAIIRNVKYKRENLKGIYRHNERKNNNYSNENIDKSKSYLNYSLKQPRYSYEKEFDRIKEEYNLQGQIKKVSNIACEYIITSDHDFFERIGEEETRRYFETAYKFISEYKNLGEQYILSARVHMDEESPHMHLIFLPVVHTKDKKGKDVDKIGCSDFWKEKDSYRRLQDAFYEYMVKNGFELQRGKPKEETNREHYSVEEYKKITNFEKTKETLKNIKLEIPEVPDIANISKFTIKRDEKILDEIIKPKDELINKLYSENVMLHTELSRQEKLIEESEKYQLERKQIIEDNRKLNKKVNKMESEFELKNENLEQQFRDKSKDLEFEYKYKINKLEKENKKLNKIIDRFYDTVEKFIAWICKKFGIGEQKELVREFERDNGILIDPEKQIKREEKEKSWDLEI